MWERPGKRPGKPAGMPSRRRQQPAAGSTPAWAWTAAVCSVVTLSAGLPRTAQAAPA